MTKQAVRAKNAQVSSKMEHTQMNQTHNSEIQLYKTSEGPELKISFKDETVWLTQTQLSELFGKERSVITKHLKNVFETAELSENSVCANFAHTGSDGKTYQVQHYNLDAVLAVGYRVNSKRATQFRVWATNTLRDYLLKGYVVNEKRLMEAHENRLKELQQAHNFMKQAFEAKRLAGYEKELAAIINDYTQVWVVLNRYDEGDLEIDSKTRKNVKELTYDRAKEAVKHFKDRLVDTDQASGTFGNERASLLSDILKEIEAKKVTLEDKASSIFYEIIKKRPFVDGNKRVASLLFVLFLIENNYLYDKKGERKFNDNALVALALLIEEAKPSEKQTTLQLLANLTNKK